MRQLKQTAHAHPLEAGRLLKGVADAQTGTLIHAAGRDIISIEQDRSGRRLFDPHDDLRQRRFSAAIGSGDDREGIFGKLQADIVENLLSFYFKREISDFQHSFTSFLTTPF